MECPSLSLPFFSACPFSFPRSLPSASPSVCRWGTTPAWGLNIRTGTKTTGQLCPERRKRGRGAAVRRWVSYFSFILMMWECVFYPWIEKCFPLWMWVPGMGRLWLSCGLWCWEISQGSLCNVNNPLDYPLFLLGLDVDQSLRYDSWAPSKTHTSCIYRTRGSHVM